MGEQKVSLLANTRQKQRFVKHLLNDVEAIEYMLDNDWFETDVIRIGAEQEMVMIDKNTCKPAPIITDVLKKMKNWDFIETELARFNLEIGLTPRVFEGNCLGQMTAEIKNRLSKINAALESFDAAIILTGILPTLRKHDMLMHNLTPKKRYAALMEAIQDSMLGPSTELHLMGIDELKVKHKTPFIESVNTSFQVHLQVTPSEFVQLYNISQLLAAPVLSIAANSPMLFGRRLWHETRIAVFQQSIDTRSSHDHMRERSPRVNFGNGWIRGSILDIYKEDITRFRVWISGDEEEDSLHQIKEGIVPKLRALQIHNSTVYRWNRPCYGISESGKPHLRIENRILPSGPTVDDEMANAALWLGAMKGMQARYADITKYISWADARDNFWKAARYGIDTKFTWLGDHKITANNLILEEILPLAREGLHNMKVEPKDIDKYLGIIEERAKTHTTGARWMLRAYTDLMKSVPRDEASSILTASIYKNQNSDLLAHEWELPHIDDLVEYKPSKIKVEEFMTTDIFTVHEGDLIDLVTDMMNWKHIRYLPVEDKMGNLIGLVTSRNLLLHFAKMRKLKSHKNSTVKDIMIEDPTIIGPEATILEAMQTMKEKEIGCLPVVQDKQLVGIITEADFLRISNRLIERLEL